MQYFGNCEERLSENRQILCKACKIKRSSCKYCRYKRCQDTGNNLPHVLSIFTGSTGKKEDTPKTSQKINDNAQEQGEWFSMYDSIEMEDTIYDTEKKFTPTYWII